MLGRSEAPQLVIINLDPNAGDTLKRVGHFPRQFPGTSFFLMSQLLDANLLMEAMHLGVREFIPLPMSEQKLTAAIERVAAGHGMGKRAKIIHVIPTIGGCGSTTVACNVAASLAKAGHKTCLLDMDLVRGGVAELLRRPPAVHDRRRDEQRRQGRQAAAGQRAVHPPHERAGRCSPGPTCPRTRSA
jgi:pilus assembly protein CpaE